MCINKITKYVFKRMTVFSAKKCYMFQGLLYEESDCGALSLSSTLVPKAQAGTGSQAEVLVFPD